MPQVQIDCLQIVNGIAYHPNEEIEVSDDVAAILTARGVIVEPESAPAMRLREPAQVQLTQAQPTQVQPAKPQVVNPSAS